MQVHKFGGASLSSLERYKSTSEIIRDVVEKPALLVISALGKTTNALEKVAEAYFAGRKEEAIELFYQVKQTHENLAKYLLITEGLACEQRMLDFFTEVEWMLHDNPVKSFDYYYDQIVCVGELLSSTLLSHYLQEIGVANVWIDVRDVLKTEDIFREARVNWEQTTRNVELYIQPLLNEGKLVITQGFIGSTDENESTTLGREGSDFSAALFGNILNAEKVTIWKDVPAVMNADPRVFKETIELPELSYAEVVEMAYYGAQVIHRKTIKPLFEKQIPLYVKSFLDPALSGTIISHSKVQDLPPIMVMKKNQVMLEFQSKDFAFIGDAYLGKLFELFEQIRLKPNLTQNAAIRYYAVFDEHDEKLSALAEAASQWLQVMVRKNLTLVTIRHPQNGKLPEMVGGKKVIITQESPEVAQYLIEDIAS